ncbi:hypothetical protein EDB89DRAFT_1906248 [Lactarius sanguifluus]|nr:hypothetical protein EDB89DRAFT_1906248 [Lactarius sanguifluus]
MRAGRVVVSDEGDSKGSVEGDEDLEMIVPSESVSEARVRPSGHKIGRENATEGELIGKGMGEGNLLTPPHWGSQFVRSRVRAVARLTKAKAKARRGVVAGSEVSGSDGNGNSDLAKAGVARRRQAGVRVRVRVEGQRGNSRDGERDVEREVAQAGERTVGCETREWSEGKEFDRMKGFDSDRREAGRCDESQSSGKASEACRRWHSAGVRGQTERRRL